MQIRRSVKSVSTLASISAIALLAGVTGCAPANPSPGVHNLSQMSHEINNDVIVSMDTNARALSNDLGRLWMTDRPSRLTFETMPH